ncbi:MAG: hypothetical protein QXQ90_09025 [Desulfurococcaceae archaeon]
MVIRIEEVRNWILGTVIGIVLVVAGLVVINILYSIGEYIVVSFSEQIGNVTVLVPPQQIQIVGLALMTAGLALVLINIGMLIKVILSSMPKTAE